MLVAFDGRAEWLAFAAAMHLSVMQPLPGLALSATAAQRIGYGTAVLIVVAVSAARWVRAQRAPVAAVPVHPVAVGPVPASPVPASPVLVTTPRG
jgi:hypothetical protein